MCGYNSYMHVRTGVAMDRVAFILLVLVSLLGACVSELEVKTGFNCTAQKTCGACVAESPECHWCKAENFPDERCNQLALLNQSSCRMEDIVSPKSQLLNETNISPRNAERGNPPIQLAPQEMRIRLRPNEPYQFRIDFRQAENYPVDIYFLMDASFTMKEYKNTLSNLTEKLVESIRSITTDFRLGFGSFVDKTILPFVLTGPNSVLVDQCSASHNCSLPYGFKNQLKLTSDDTEFKQKVAALSISANLDSPEGGFDAIMQAVVCKEDIGWRDKSRKMILFSTDGSFHYAGDGLLGGIVIPNDGKCHLTSEGFYSESTIQDYPSINQLAQKILEMKVNIMFIVPQSQFVLYTKLSDHVIGSNVGQLKADSSNVIDLVKENYNKIRNTVELKEENLGDLRIEYRAQCTSSVRDGAMCDQLEIGKSVSFNVTIKADSCPSDPLLRNRTFYINPVGLTERLTITVELICECDCESQYTEELNSTKCSARGTFECGICSCNRGFYGPNCSCGAGDDIQNELACKMSNTSEVCQGRGQCSCGQCFCGALNPAQPERRYSGAYCQCNDYNCEYSGTQMCGGPAKGVCRCGSCQCSRNYTGTACDCLNSTSECMTPDNKLCNDKGACVCGACQCKDVFRGKYCEDCPTCPGKCEEYRYCVQCQFREKDNECHKTCTELKQVNDLSGKDEWRPCMFRDDDQCDVRFEYNYKTNEVNFKRTKECVTRTSNLVIILSVIGVVIAVGIIALLIWKVFVTFHDKREYQAFVDEQSKARWDVAQNPIYKNATTNFQNPTYRPTSTVNH